MVLIRMLGVLAKASLAAVAFGYARSRFAGARAERRQGGGVDSATGARIEPRGWPSDWEHASEVENPGDPGPSILIRENPVDPREDDGIPGSRPGIIGI